MDWNNFGQRQDGPADASEQWVERNMGAIANVQQQSGQYGAAMGTWVKLFGFLLQNRRG